MVKCSVRHSLFERDVSTVRYEWVNGLDHKRSSDLIRFLMGNIEVIIYYLPWSPRIKVFLKVGKLREPLFDFTWVYSKAVAGTNYDNYLYEHLRDAEDDDPFVDVEKWLNGF